MKVKTGYLYHIKDEYFDIANDGKLMTEHERGKKNYIFYNKRWGYIMVYFY